MLEENKTPESNRNTRSHSTRVSEALREDPGLMIRDIHKILTGDGYGNRGLVVNVKKNTAHRYKREEERRHQVRFAKIIGTVTTGSGGAYLIFKEKIMRVIEILFS